MPSDRAGALGRIEAEAQRVLLERRQALRAGPPRPEGEGGGQPPPPLTAEQRHELAAIEDALARIAEGRFGTCVACGGPMGLQRIRAIPEARYCLGCSGRQAGEG